ncbi:MAG: hypothetical protein ACJA2S_002345 [Cyclobacteriaceae bacterium]|jgi:hypothetical protein
MNTAKFRTELQAPTSEIKIGLDDSIITIGSCFSDVIGSYLINNKFNTLVNPFGTVYNPVSIFDLLMEQEWDDNKFVESNGSIFHHDVHSSFFSDSIHELTKELKNIKKQTIKKLNNCDWLIVTLGTAVVYKLKDTGDVVANCHKVPQRKFLKVALSVKEMIHAFEAFYNHIKEINPSIHILFTVSPVRHIKDGLQDNAVSKSKLRVVCDEFQKQYSNVHYFPSYEIMMDDLRDYRFFESDMIHPNEVAENYIWNKFQETYFDNETQQFTKDWKKIKDALAHKPFNHKSEAHQNFLTKTLVELGAFTEKIDVSREESILKEQLI